MRVGDKALYFLAFFGILSLIVFGVSGLVRAGVLDDAFHQVDEDFWQGISSTAERFVWNGSDGKIEVADANFTVVNTATQTIGGVIVDNMCDLSASNVFSGATNTFNNIAVADGQGVVVGNLAQITVAGSAPELQILGTGGGDERMVLGMWSASAGAPIFLFTKSRNATIGSSTIVEDNDVVGQMLWTAADGNDFNTQIAEIRGLVDDGTPAENQIGGELLLRTATAGGSLTTAVIIDNTQDFDFQGNDITGTGDILPNADNASNLGSAPLSWNDGWIQNSFTVGHIQELYTADPNYTYEVGDVVALDSSGDFEFKPSIGLADRIIGVVAVLPYTDTIPEEYIINETTNETATRMVNVSIEDYHIAIYGKYKGVKVKGTINVGDILVGSDESGVLTSMYNTAHPLWPSVMSASTNPNYYNSIAKLLPYGGLAMEAYNSTDVGLIKVVLGKP